MRRPQKCQSAGIARTATAVCVLLAFWGALAHTFWPEMVPALLRVIQSVRGVGAEEVESTYLAVRDNSSAPEALVREAVAQLESDYVAVQAYLCRGTDHRVPVLITNGQGPAVTDGVRLSIFYDHGAIDLTTAPFLLVLLGEGSVSTIGTSVFVEGGLAVHVAEGVGRSQALLGQSTDAWVTLLRQNGTLLPLVEAWAVELPQSEGEMPDVARALLEGGSFVGWVANTFGLDAVQGLRDGLSTGDALGLSMDEAERAWLASVASQGLSPRRCVDAVAVGSPLHGLCGRLDPGE